MSLLGNIYINIYIVPNSPISIYISHRLTTFKSSLVYVFQNEQLGFCLHLAHSKNTLTTEHSSTVSIDRENGT